MKWIAGKNRFSCSGIPQLLLGLELARIQQTCRRIRRAWNAIAGFEELVPHREDIRILVRGIDRFLRFPFRDFNDCAVTRAQ
ncbi:MAG: hypothetical protein C5B58_09280 [Acidobacteria bacterium]|nr:MAG: hypothetical protein C5B58_09280 [Acidobacteriota bacterium]